jgi:hypothetical protein
MKTIILLFAMLGFATVQGDDHAPFPQITLSCREKTWVIVNTDFPNVRGIPGTMERLQVTVKNNLPEKKIFTSYETFLPFIETKGGGRILFSGSGRDHCRLPQASEFITLAPGQTGTLSLEIALCKAGSEYLLWYECPTGDCYDCKLPPGTYNLGIRYRVPADFFDGFNDPKRESYHQPWDEARLIWNGTVDSDVISIEIK